MKIDIRTVDVSETDTCPAHGGDCRREYTFGMMDAEIYTYEGCKCAVVVQFTLAGGNSAALCATYNEAAGIARLQVALNSSR